MSEPPRVTVRILTDHRITQLPWWSERLAILRPPTGHGPSASLSVAARAIWQSRKFDVFISANVRNALAIGLFKRFTGRRRPLIVMTEMRLDDARPTLAWKVKVQVQRFGYAAVDAMCLSSRREAGVYAERLRLSPDRFRFIPWHTNVLEPKWFPPKGEYLFAAGRTGRDWRTLADAVRGLAVPVTVVCSQQDASRVDFPDNVTVLTDVPYAKYRELLEGAKIVLVPLESHEFSSGQVVILEAMALGKPVVSARVLGSEDYVIEGVDGCLVEPGNSADLRRVIDKLLSSPDLADSLGRAALDKVRRVHTLDQYARNILDVVGSLASPPQS